MTAVKGAQTEAGLRLDKWLFQARFFKSRSLAAKFVEEGKVRIDGTKVSKSHHKLRCGAVLTFPKANYVRVIKVLALGSRRGPASEARALYEDLNPPESQPALPHKGKRADRPFKREEGAGRPTKKDRRQMDRLRERAKGQTAPSEEGLT